MGDATGSSLSRSGSASTDDLTFFLQDDILAVCGLVHLPESTIAGKG